MPLVTLDFQDASTRTLSPVVPRDLEAPKKTLIHYLPLCGTVFLLAAPHPSIIYVLVKYHLLTRQDTFQFLGHLFVLYCLTFLTFSSLIVCLARDPGPVDFHSNGADSRSGNGGDDDGEDLREALMSSPDDDFNGPAKWCRICWAPKPERTHHCSQCGRCVLKMDHHCPWLGARCIGHRTYPAFVHFLTGVTLFSAYLALINGQALWYAFNHVLIIDETVYLHELSLFFAGLVFGLVIGSFLAYHLYLISTNQTTLENISHFFLLRYLPPLPRSTNDGHSVHSLSDPPMEHELSYAQRCLVKDAHSAIKLYDVGLKRNWAQVFGWKHKWGWVARLLYGGGSIGDGRTFARNPRADEMLNTLAVELVKAGKER